MAPPLDLDALARALRRASETIDDPGRRVAAALADDPRVQEWAAAAALTELGAPRHAGEMVGRLAVVAVGRHAATMVEGARGVFGATLDEGVVVMPRRATPPDAPEMEGEGDSPTPPHVPIPGFVVIEAASDRPDEGSFEAGRHIEALVGGLGTRDRLLVLLSDGADRLPALPVGGLDPWVFRRALDVVGGAAGAGAGAALAATLRARLDALQAGGLAALVSSTPILALRLASASSGADTPPAPALDPLGGPPPSGRAVEIALRRAGLWEALPRPAREALRVDGLHPALDPERESRTESEIRDLDGEGAGLSAALAEARRRGLATTVLTTGLRGDAGAAGRGMAKVGRALQDGLGGLPLPACALAVGWLAGGAERHARFARAAADALEGRRGLRVVSWTPVAGGSDLCAVLARDG